MKTFDELKAAFTRDLLELEKLTGMWPGTIEKRHVKEQQIGRYCYEAEEDARHQRHQVASVQGQIY